MWWSFLVVKLYLHARLWLTFLPPLCPRMNRMMLSGYSPMMWKRWGHIHDNMSWTTSRNMPLTSPLRIWLVSILCVWVYEHIICRLECNWCETKVTSIVPFWLWGAHKNDYCIIICSNDLLYSHIGAHHWQVGWHNGAVSQQTDSALPDQGHKTAGRVQDENQRWGHGP